MAFYTFEHPETGEHIEVQQRMKAEHIYVDDKDVEGKRVFINPNVSFDTQPDIFSPTEMARSVDNKQESYGELLDRSKEASQKRKDKMGYDPIQTQWYDDYAKKRKGKRHPSDPKAGDPDAKVFGV